jgi:PhzF family phenazine biosynthesis protein
MAAGVGGNPAPIVPDGTDMTDSDMQDVARDHARESAFVLPAPKDSEFDFSLGFRVPEHEMEMCGHATVGTVWLTNRLGLLHKDQLSIWTQSGPATARIADQTSSDTCVESSQPHGRVEAVDGGDIVDDILSVLRITPDDLTAYPIQNARTSRTKTLIPLMNAAGLEKLKPEFSLVEELCEKLDSTGLYPYAVVDEDNQIFEARQFFQIVQLSRRSCNWH